MSEKICCKCKHFAELTHVASKAYGISCVCTRKVLDESEAIHAFLPFVVVQPNMSCDKFEQAEKKKWQNLA